MTAITFWSHSTPTGNFNFWRKVASKLAWFRIRNHLKIVENELYQKNVKHLSIELKKERNKNINRLHDYWTNGLYPTNTDFPDKRVPYFKDKFGIPCAMAYLIEQSNHQDLVDSVSSTNNHIYVTDIYEGPVFEWIKGSGLTKAEAARVQPTYDPSTYKPDLFFQIFPWIVGFLGFILLEWLNYKFSRWLVPENKKKRLIAWLYFTLNNIVLAFVLTFFVMSLYSHLRHYF